MAEKLIKCGLKREEGHLYFVGKDGNVYKVKMARGGKRPVNHQGPIKVFDANIKREPKKMYFLDKEGDVSVAVMGRSGRPTGRPPKKSKQ